jgi:DNA-binding transcriptional ArsR family regulator
MLAQNVKRVFEELDEEAIEILSIVASKGKMTAYEVWKESKQRIGIPQRTVYEKLRWLKGQGYVVEIQGKLFKRMYERNLRKIYYDVTLKGMLAALGDEKLLLKGAFFERLRSTLHIPPEYEKTVKPIVSIWAYCESKLRSRTEKIDEGSIFLSVLQAIVASMGIGIYSVLKEELSLPDLTKFRDFFEITNDEYEALWNFLSVILAFLLPESFELNKRSLSYAAGLSPMPCLSDCIEILPDFGIRVFWSTAESFASLSIADHLRWLYMHRDIADFIAKGDGIGLDQYLKKSISILYPSWLPMCFRRELDGTCSLKGVKCSYSSSLDCHIVREHATTFKAYLDGVIKRLTHKLKP